MPLSAIWRKSKFRVEAKGDVMERYCDECGAYLIHLTRSGCWECSNSECYAYNFYFKPVSKGKGFFYKVVRVTYAAVL